MPFPFSICGHTWEEESNGRRFFCVGADLSSNSAWRVPYVCLIRVQRLLELLQDAVFEGGIGVHLFSQFSVVSDHDAGKGEFFAQGTDELKDQMPGATVQVACGFIGQEESRFHDKCPGQGRTLLFTAREFAHLVTRSMVQFHLLQQMVGRSFHFFFLPAGNQSGHHYIFKSCKFGQQMMELKDEAHRAVAKVTEFLVSFPAQGSILKKEFSTIGTVKGPQNLQQGGLAGAGSPDNSHHLPSVDAEIDTPEYMNLFGAAVVTFTKVFGPEKRGCARGHESTSAGLTFDAFQDG